jgi:prolyl-tRNA synthetase
MTLAWAYSFTTLGLRVLRKIENIVREEMNAIGSAEVLMSALGARESWEKTGRWDTVDVLFKLPAAEGREYALNPTHEEVVTPLVWEFIQSYKDLENPSVYQIQWKFRNEKRAKSGLLRGREFLMKDAYSFHRTQEELDAYFEVMHAAYDRVFARLGLADSTYYTFASGGDFSKYSYEFQTELSIGEDEIYICEKCGQAHNLEIIDPENFVCAECGHTSYQKKIVSEVGNIFKLSSRFSEAFGLKYQDADGKTVGDIMMGCYGIGISRLMGVIAEKFADEKWLVWPESIAPYSHVIIVIGDRLEEAEKLAEKLETENQKSSALSGTSFTKEVSVLIDDRAAGFGQKAGDADLFGIPHRIIISDKTIEKWGYELKKRNQDEGEIITF